MRYSKMTTDFSLQDKQYTYVDSTQNTVAANSVVGNHLANGTAGALNIEPLKDNGKSGINDAKKQYIDKAISEIIKGTGLTLEEAKKMLAVLNKDNKSLDAETLTKVLNCLKYAIEDCTLNGKLDKEKLQKVFGCYVFMTVMSDKKKMSCDDARKVMNMSLVQFVAAHNPNIKGKKNLTANDVKESLRIFIKHSFTPQKLQELKEVPESAKNTIKSMFGILLSNCKQDELNLLFEAFVMLLQDDDIVEHIPVLITEVCNNLKNDKTGKLKKFLTQDLEKILLGLGFDKQSIQKLKEFGLMQNINENNIEELLNSGLKFLQTIDPKHLPILLEALEASLKGEKLSRVQIDILDKYKPQLDQLISVIGAIANNPALIKGHEELFKQIQQILQDTKLDNYLYISVQDLFNQYPDLFNNCKDKDDLAKILNKLTDNKFSAAVGDSNPDNLYNGSTSEKTGNLGFEQTCTSDNYWTALARQNDLSQTLYIQNKSNEPEYIVLKNTESSEKKALFITPWQKYQSVKNLSVKDLYEGLSKKTINIDVVLDNYKDLSRGAKLFVNKLIEIMSPAEQNFRLDGMPSSAAIDIIKHSNINPEDLKLALDYASRKELEKFEEQKAAV